MGGCRLVSETRITLRIAGSGNDPYWRSMFSELCRLILSYCKVRKSKQGPEGTVLCVFEGNAFLGEV